MPLMPIECANCGAKYRLPETFKAAQAKCKKCGAVIDVAGQRDAAAAEAAPEQPAAAEPEAGARRRASPTRRASGVRAASAADDDAPAPERASSRTRRRASDGGDGDTPAAGRRRRAPREPKKSNTPLIAGSLIGIVAVVVVLVIFVLNRGQDEQPAEATQTAADSAQTAPAVAEEPVAASPDRFASMRAALAGLPAEDRGVLEQFVDQAQKGQVDLATLDAVNDQVMLRFAAAVLKGAGVPAEATRIAAMAKESDVEPQHLTQVVAAVGELARSEKAPDAAVLVGMLKGVGEAKPAAAAAKSQKPKGELKSPDDVFKPKAELQPLAWPEFVSEKERAEIAEHLTAMRDGGLPGARGKTALEELGAKAIVGIVNQLRELDYLDWEDTMFAYELNRLLSAMAAGVVNAGFRACDAGAEIPLEDADWNGKTVKAWQRFAAKYGSDPESLDRMVKLRKSKDMGQ